MKQTEHLVYSKDNVLLGHLYGLDIQDLTFIMDSINEFTGEKYTGATSSYTDKRRIVVLCMDSKKSVEYIVRKVRK